MPPYTARWFCTARPGSLPPATALPLPGIQNHRQLSFSPICGVTRAAEPLPMPMASHFICPGSGISSYLAVTAQAWWFCLS